MNRLTWLALAAEIGALGCRSHGPSDAHILLSRDRAWAEVTRERGTEGFASFLAPDAATIRPDQPRISGRQAVVEAWRPLLDNPSRVITWEPESATLSDLGDMGFTVGTFEIISKIDAGAPIAGKYETIWRRESSGEWDVVFDSGVTDTRSEPR